MGARRKVVWTRVNQQQLCSGVWWEQGGRASSSPLSSPSSPSPALPSTHDATMTVESSNNSEIYAVASTAELNPKQVERLRGVLDERVEVHGRGNFPTLTVRLHDLIVRVREQLRSRGVEPKRVKMNGGAASFVVAAEDFVYSDLDLIFPVSFNSPDAFDHVRLAVFDALVHFLPTSTVKARISPETLKDVYIRKMVKVNDDDRWSLFSLHNNYGRCIELKFVDRMRRQFEFSVDSFQVRSMNQKRRAQITLDALLDHFDNEEPRVEIESMYGDIQQAMTHLHERLIDTRRPEEIRGGGLLKYCHLLSRGYKAARPHSCRQLERYMCSRFFIDFPDLASQETKLRAYLDNHFGHADQAKYDYLLLLHHVIAESTVCLMNHERRQTLAMVDRLAQQLSLRIFYHNQNPMCSHTPRQTLLYLPRDTSQWVPVV